MKIGLSSNSIAQLRKAALQQRASEVSHAPIQDAVEISETARKDALVRGMIRVSANSESNQKMIRALRHLPMEALQRISDFGTKIEIHDKEADNLPLYAQNLRKPYLSGVYSPTANLLVVDKDNVTARVVVHEAMHALDKSLGEPSLQKPWTIARDLARKTRKAIRPYATHNSLEYFADNLAASLFDQATMKAILAEDFRTGTAIGGLSQQDILENHAHYHREGQAEVDPIGSKLCNKFWSVLPQYRAMPTQKALSPEEYRGKILEMHRRRKAAK